MLSSLRSAAASTSRALSQQQRGFKCSVLGAAGGIGQPLLLLLKLNPRVTELTCYDVAPITPGVAADLSHISSNSRCTGYTGDDLKKALDGCDVVVIPAGVPRKPGMTRDDLFNINAGIVKNLVAGCAEACPKACILVISNPVNSTVPIAAEVLKHKGVYNPKKLFGVTTLDVCRARTFVAQAKGNDVLKTRVPVVGGHAGTTIVPLLSQADPKVEFSDRVMAGFDGEKNVVECTFVEQDKVSGLTFFSLPVTLGKEGVETIHDYGTVTAHEKKLIADMTPDLAAQAEKGIKFATK